MSDSQAVSIVNLVSRFPAYFRGWRHSRGDSARGISKGGGGAGSRTPDTADMSRML
jgi:hypothetical protein